MAKSNLTISVRVRYQKWRMRAVMLLMRFRLARLSIWLLNGLRFDVKVGNRDWTEHGRIKATYDK